MKALKRRWKWWRDLMPRRALFAIPLAAAVLALVLFRGDSRADLLTLTWKSHGNTGYGTSFAWDTVTNYACNNAWSCAATGQQTITSGNGYIKFYAGETNTYKMGALQKVSANVNDSYADLSYAFYPSADGILYVYEVGNAMTNCGAYTTNDVFKIAVENGAVKYYKNAALCYTSGRAVSYPLTFDSSFYTYGAKIKNVIISTDGVNESPVAWSHLASNINLASGVITANYACAWNCGGNSDQTLTGDGYVEFSTNENNTYKMAGLTISSEQANYSYSDISYAAYPAADGILYIYEAGNQKTNCGAYAANDVFRVAVEGGVVKYRKNGNLCYTSAKPVSYPLLVDYSLYSSGATLKNFTFLKNDYRRFATGQTNQQIEEYGGCRQVTNNTGKDLFIPVRTQAEWNSFVGASPSGITIAACPPRLTWTGSASGNQSMTSGSMKVFTAGVYTLTVSQSVTLRMGGAAGGAAGSAYNYGGLGGGGGASTNFESSVTLNPGVSYTLQVGAAGQATYLSSAGYHIYLNPGSGRIGGEVSYGTGRRGGYGGFGGYTYEPGTPGEDIVNGTGGGGGAGGTCDWQVPGSGGQGGRGGNGVTAGGAAWTNSSGYAGQNGGCYGTGAYGNQHYGTPGGGGGGWAMAGLSGSYGGGGGGSTTGYSNPDGGAGGPGVFVFLTP